MILFNEPFHRSPKCCSFFELLNSTISDSPEAQLGKLLAYQSPGSYDSQPAVQLLHLVKTIRTVQLLHCFHEGMDLCLWAPSILATANHGKWLRLPWHPSRHPDAKQSFSKTASFHWKNRSQWLAVRSEPDYHGDMVPWCLQLWRFLFQLC